MHVFTDRRGSAELDCNRCICGHARLTNDDAFRNDASRDDAASTAVCATDHDRPASVLQRSLPPFPQSFQQSNVRLYRLVWFPVLLSVSLSLLWVLPVRLRLLRVQ